MNLLLILLLLFTLPAETPPGTKKVGTLFMDKTEILNIHWMEYLYYQKKELDSTAYNALLPHQSNTWYSLHETRYQPIVLITHQQAVDFCKWRSKMVSAKLKKKVTYRLPSPQEWATVAQATKVHSVAHSKKDKAPLKKKPTNTLLHFDVKDTKDAIYHLFDNVSEMTQEEGLAMGPSNHDLTNNNKGLGPISYKAPNPYLGFRCVAEVEE